MSKGKVVVGMSGGVDSSVAAWLLKEQGYDVIGVTMQIWQDEENTVQEENGGCCGLSAVDDARRVAAAIGIPYYVMNFKDEFQKSVIEYFTKEYLAGRTPNPCIACNRYVKWEALLQRSLSIGADYIATGHYARIEHLPNGRYAIRRSATMEKDQTYALYNLTQEQLARTLMPVGEYSKDRIREMADEIGLLVAHKPDSQDICFVPDGDYASFIENTTDQVLPTGNFVTPEGKVLGKHKGMIGTYEESLTYTVRANELNFMSVEQITEPVRIFAKIRYNHKGAWCTVERTGEDEIVCTFDEPIRAATPGQAVVLYDGEYVLGGGTIL